MTNNIEDMQASFKRMMLEHKRLSALKERYIEHGQRLDAIIQAVDDIKRSLMTLQRDIDPGLLLKRQMSETKRNTKTSSYVEAMHGQIMAGQDVTMRYLSQAYPDLSENTITYIFRLLKSSANVDHTLDGTKARLFRRLEKK